jgi:NADH-quinone oxidoreductase subunit H
VSWLGFLKYAPVAAFAALGAFVFWFGRKSRVNVERYFLVGVSAACFFLAVVVALPVVNSATQGIFWFAAKVLVFLYAFIWYRGTFPRYRYDQLMNLGWRWMIPLALANIIVTALVRYWVSPHPASAAAFWIR